MYVNERCTVSAIPRRLGSRRLFVVRPPPRNKQCPLAQYPGPIPRPSAPPRPPACLPTCASTAPSGAVRRVCRRACRRACRRPKAAGRAALRRRVTESGVAGALPRSRRCTYSFLCRYGCTAVWSSAGAPEYVRGTLAVRSRRCGAGRYSYFVQPGLWPSPRPPSAVRVRSWRGRSRPRFRRPPRCIGLAPPPPGVVVRPPQQPAAAAAASSLDLSKPPESLHAPRPEQHHQHGL